MIKIIHLSDFHLNKQSIADWNSYILDALSTLLNKEKGASENTFVVCTGDLVDKGGADYSDITTAFNIFKEQVIESILNHTHLPKDHFIIIPGNHDIERNADKPFENAGLRVEFKTKGLSYINQYTKSLLENPDKQGAQRIVKYKKFESELYHDCPNINCSFLSTTFRYNVDGDEIGFAGLNSAWNAYDDNDYEEGLVLGEPQYNVCLSNLKDCRIKIALMHHPLDWLKLEKGTIGKLYYNDFNLSLVGHVHDGNTTFETKLYGTLFTNIAPSCTSDIRDGYYGAFANGVSIIEYNPESKSIDCSYYIYSFADRSYILNSGIVEGGKCHFTIPNPNSSNLQDITENALKYIKEHYYPIMDGYIIPQKANIIQSLKDAFVMPPIKKHGVSAAEPIIIDFNYILKNKSHQAFFGSHESGKTVLLYRLLIEYVEHYIQYDLIPVYIDFEEMGNKNIDTIIKEFIDCSSSQIKELLATQNFVLLIDNYNPIPENAYKTQRLYKFVQDYNVKIIASVEHDLIGSLPLTFINSDNQIAFEWYYIEHLKAVQVKELMMKWSPQDEFIQRNSKLERMVSNFCSYSLPCTAMSVSLYLWSTENADREPVNQAVLLDIYIEIILEKLQKENIYRNTFDYQNKSMLLARIAKNMSESGTYELTYSNYMQCIENYLQIVGFTTYKADKLGDYFVTQKIFTRTGNNIKFAHSCFFHFFLAKRMIDDIDFKNHILSEDQFYKHHRAIDYYTGLKRNDSDTLRLLHSRFVDFFKSAEPIYDEIDIDECFTKIVENKPTYIPKAAAVNVNEIRTNKPSQEKIDQKLNNYCDERLSQISDDISKFKNISPDQLIIMMCNILRNSEGVEDITLKQNVYNGIIKNALIWTVVAKNSLAQYANTHNGNLPAYYNDVKNIEAFFRFMPFILQYSINIELGTNKLNSIFKKKIEIDKATKVSDVEKFVSIAMYWDNNGNDYEKDIRYLIKSVKRNSVQDYLLLKLLDYYKYRTKKGSDEEKLFLDLVSDLRIKNEKLPKRLKDKVMKLIRDKKS